MSNDTEALAPQNDATATQTPAQPDGAEREARAEAVPSTAANVKASDTEAEPETKGVQRRFDELTRLRRDAERRESEKAKEAEFWRERALKHEQPAPAAPAKAKTLADFNFDEGQHQSYLMQEAAKAATEAAKRELKAEQDQQAKQRRTATFVQRAKEFAKTAPDYAEVVPYAPLSDGVAEILIGIESGPELAYHLAKNPEIATEVSSLPNEVAAFELGQIAARLKFERESLAKAKNVVSSAPPPSPRIEASGDAGAAISPDSADSDNLSDAEWAKKRDKQVQKRRKA